MADPHENLSAQNPVSKPLSGRVALVTGGTRGIGFQIALSLAAAGADLSICGLNEDRLKEIEQYFSETGIQILALPCDVRDEKQVKRLISHTIDAKGSLDILVNNAGIYRTQTVLGHPLDVWNEVLETNLTGAMLVSREVIAGMVARNWGRIINISSVSGKVGELAGSAYSASKFGMIGLTQSLALELARHAITVNAVCPGWVLTDLARDQLTDLNWCDSNSIDPPQSIEIARLSIPQMEFTRAEEVASLVTYLCGDSARGITGQAINICGGLSLH
jgi:NAD(P)-dependent dehydrogenase (short-subunit alcohol dehydrogenase family)